MNKSLLLVDDNAHILETMHDILEAAGFTVRTSETGAAALQALKAQPSHLMIADFNLLDMTGAKLTVEAKIISPDLQVILMTGEAHVDAGAAKDMIRATLTKPINPSQLIEIIKKIVDA